MAARRAAAGVGPSGPFAPRADTLGNRLQPRPRQRPHGRACQCLQERLGALGAGTEPQALPEIFKELMGSARVQGAGCKKGWESDELYQRFKAAAEKLREGIKEAEGQAAFDSEKAQTAAEHALNLLRLAEGANAAYEARKRELAALDFDDLLIRARDLLAGPAGGQLRRRLGRGLRLLLVDEFQDTDPLQVEVVAALCGEELTAGKLFFVGDHKQSIYRFRGADPRVFRQLSAEIPAAGRLPLSLNFRSQPAILEFVNALFCGEMPTGYEPLQAQRPQVGPRPAVELLWAVPGDEEQEPEGGAPSRGEAAGRQVRLRRLEARWIARRIRAILDCGEKIVCDEKSQARAAGPATWRSSSGALQRGDL